MSIRIAGVGLGGHGRNNLQALQQMPPWEVVGGADVSPQARAQAEKQLGVPVFASVEELLEKVRPEVVYVATSTFAHVQPTVMALQAGCHVVLDKPMGANLAEADEMIAAARAGGRRLLVYHNRRGDGDYLTLSRLVQEGAVGRPVLFQSRLMSNAREPKITPENWRLDPARGGGSLLDWGPHLVDQVLALMLGKPVRVLAEVRTLAWQVPVENYFHVQIWFDDGGLAQVEYNNAAPLDLPRFYVLGDRACVLKLGMEGCVSVPSLLHTHFLVRDYAEGKVEMVPSMRSDHLLLWRNLAEVFSGEAEPLVPLEHAYAVMAVLDAARRSAQSGELVIL